MEQDPILRPSYFQIAGTLFRNKKSHQMILLDFLCNVLEVKLTGFCLTHGLENGGIVLTALGVEDPPDAILPVEAVDIRATATDGEIMRTASLFQQALLQLCSIHAIL